MAGTGVGYYNIQQIPSIPQDIHMITIGAVMYIFRQQNFISFIINDGTATAQATFYQKKSYYQSIPWLPSIGSTIQILGKCLTKPIANESKLFLKIKIDKWNILTQSQQIKIYQEIYVNRQTRFNAKITQQTTLHKKKAKIKQKSFSQSQMVDIRSLVFSYMYIVFSSNNDINSFIFCPKMVVTHKISKQYAKDNQISQSSLQQVIKRTMQYLLAHEIIQLKQRDTNKQLRQGAQQQYIIKKRYFQRLIVEIQQFVYDKKPSGTTLEQVTMQLNRKMGKYTQQTFIFNYKFIQKVLLDLINQHRIYKTSDKRLYPYSS